MAVLLSLITAACYGAGALADQPDSVRDSLHRFGLNTGIAFQIYDDVLDYIGDPEVMGKNVGDDLSEGKPTLPLIHVLRQGSATEQTLVRDAITERSADNIEPILVAVCNSGALDYARAQARHYQGLALAALDELPANPYRDAMRTVAELAINRDH